MLFLVAFSINDLKAKSANIAFLLTIMILYKRFNCSESRKLFLKAIITLMPFLLIIIANNLTKISLLKK